MVNPTRYNHANVNECVYFTYPNKFSYINTGNFIEPGKPTFYCSDIEIHRYVHILYVYRWRILLYMYDRDRALGTMYMFYSNPIPSTASSTASTTVTSSTVTTSTNTRKYTLVKIHLLYIYTWIVVCLLQSPRSHQMLQFKNHWMLKRYANPCRTCVFG